ncbi:MULTISPECIES: DUF4142 domain-containing protein [Rufibacter]|uniref:Putative membrane protein n=1 Tax=Rufibacter quisquiliarum TaxID=1549639 RepID=A0A839GMX9_9BACT|nr:MULTISPECIES: DUF4142 domain-containing protein [Rufibacter]MBA9079263.1 putative membrane protein [Rufibacter quisquiliarum]
MKKNLFHLICGGALLFWVSGCGGSSDSTSVDAAAKHNEELLESTGKDEAAGWFVAEAASHNMLSAELGRLASSKAVNPGLKQFGQLLLDHHTQTNAQLKQIADLKNLITPTKLGNDHQDLYNDILSKTGAGFDQAYLEAVVENHEEIIKKYEEMANEGKDPELKSYAAKALPTLRAHVEQAEQLESQVQK